MSPPAAAAATRKVPLSIRSGMMRWLAPCNFSTPVMLMVSLPSPEIFAPIARRQFARSTTSGSRAAFSSTVTPSASAAAIIRFSVPVTLTRSKNIRAPLSRFLPLDLRMDVAVLDVNFRTHRLQTFDVQVNRTRTDGAAAGQRNARFAETCYQRPQHQDRGAHGFHHVVGRFQFVHLRAAQRHCSSCYIRRHAHLHQQLAHRGDIVQIRHVVQMQFIRRQQPGAHDGQRRVLRPGNAHLTVEAIAALDR